MRKNKYNLQLKNNKLIPLKFKEGKVFLYLQLRYLHQVGYSIWEVAINHNKLQIIIKITKDLVAWIFLQGKVIDSLILE
jgi:hypothetical protein